MAGGITTEKGQRFGTYDAGVVVSGVDGTVQRLRTVAARLADPAPALEAIAAEFSIMERMRFASGGAAPAFGITETWKPVGYKTAWNKRSMGFPAQGRLPLIASGGLRQAAINPRIEMISSKTMDIKISTAGQLGSAYNVGHDYGHFHQAGIGVPTRQFVTLTPIFYAQAVLILRQYVVGGRKKSIGQKTNPSSIRIQKPVHHKRPTRVKVDTPNEQMDFGRWMHMQDPSISAEAHLLRYEEVRKHHAHVFGRGSRAVDRYFYDQKSVLTYTSYHRYLKKGAEFHRHYPGRAASGLAGK